jgi:hypothetical protein
MCVRRFVRLINSRFFNPSLVQKQYFMATDSTSKALKACFGIVWLLLSNCDEVLDR